jgi:hypothetical protein
MAQLDEQYAEGGNVESGTFNARTGKSEAMSAACRSAGSTTIHSIELVHSTIRNIENTTSDTW